jgi:Leucine-rich repeat (LRR) protein
VHAAVAATRLTHPPLPPSLLLLLLINNLSPSLCALPADLSAMTQLCVLAVQGAPNHLQQLPPSLSALGQLQDLVLQGCVELACLSLPVDGLTSLTRLVLNMDCSVPPDELHAEPASLTSISSSLGRLPVLQELALIGNNQLAQLPAEIGDLKSLRSLKLIGALGREGVWLVDVTAAEMPAPAARVPRRASLPPQAATA